jgi:hypothetical protein
MFADPREIKNQRARERYALHRDEILKKRREAREHKKAAAAALEPEAVSMASDTIMVRSHIKRRRDVHDQINTTSTLLSEEDHGTTSRAIYMIFPFIATISHLTTFDDRLAHSRKGYRQIGCDATTDART